ncbi:hypothetical protein HORIV_31730 [Vreelandella olivaria]|uniref:Phosphoribosylanthranilate isomerase n=1 Tax=Vreelandella olivaria TaxID=390919 RepID=A0ABM7GJE9_9GAMM|nr:hypothetical protein HORIV_31730 [Halomonas olivaria]
MRSAQLTRTRIKFCGFTREQDIDRAVALGADALGFVMWPKSARSVNIEQLAVLSARVPAFVTRVGCLLTSLLNSLSSACPILICFSFTAMKHLRRVSSTRCRG